MQLYQVPCEDGSYVRILTLNGGGARCWSALLILEELMRRVSKPGNGMAKPCEYFHLIVGSEWGGVLAIMLGRLQFSIVQCRERLGFLTFPCAPTLFRVLPLLPRLRSRYYKLKFQEWFRSDDDLGTPFHDANLKSNSALTMVIATDPTNLGSPKQFRSYLKSGTFEEDKISAPIWKVALAIIATPIDLDPVLFDDTQATSYTCIASSLAGLSNPSWVALNEAREHFSPNSVHTLLNIGCGSIRESKLPQQIGAFWPVVRGRALTRMVIDQVNDADRAANYAGSSRGLLRETANSNLYYEYFSASGVTTSYYDWSFSTKKIICERTERYIQSSMVQTRLSAMTERLQNLRDLSAFNSYEAHNQDEVSSSRPWLEELERVQQVVRGYSASPPVKLAILDTGIDGSHPWIKLKWKQTPTQRRFFDFTNSDNNHESEPIDESGHGTQMAGIILEVVPYVELYVIRVFKDRNFEGREGELAMDRVREAILFATNTLKVNIISMSFAFEGPPRNDLDNAITQAIKRNVIMFAAASNSGFRQQNPYPASDRRVFRVNAVDDHGHGMKCNPPAGIDHNNDNLAIKGDKLLCPWPDSLNPKDCQEHPHTGKPGLWKYASGTSPATALLSAVCGMTMNFGRQLPELIGYHFGDIDVNETWGYINKPQGIRHLLWYMAGGRNHRTPEGFSYICPWILLSPERLHESGNFNSISKKYFDVLCLGREAMS